MNHFEQKMRNIYFKKHFFHIFCKNLFFMQEILGKSTENRYFIQDFIC
ncbi:hypothetical protein B4064_3400 [Caldibacillus thermoamylovorans]|uniref:Uncharacterized protein n=1 Tax=Caldibacillus thermoamylovorans TaxID=35841 RepID=A0A0D0ERT6_9BACI|nr:hypothetical protein B4064_3400 [Caldibacillus thermoamylovorans]KIO62441.1 hypothetical protein B4065_3124 [Caldibacillus thermoamylovorans]KIO72715.1 hypothetical protein B4167_2766 [Caldibacillus thermoamylovorans]